MCFRNPVGVNACRVRVYSVIILYGVVNQFDGHFVDVARSLVEW